MSCPDFRATRFGKELVGDLKLGTTGANELEWVLKFALRDLASHFAKQPDRNERRALTARLKRFQTALQQLTSDLEDRPDHLKKILPLESREVMGHWLTDESLRRKRIQLDDRTDPNEQRKDIGLDDGFELFAQMLTEVREPIDLWFQADVSDRGGLKPNYVRTTLINRLAQHAVEITGVRATTTANGRFEKLCTAVFHVLKLNADGLDVAIERTLRKYPPPPPATQSNDEPV